MSLTIVYGVRRFKIPVTPSTLLSQVRQQICASLKLTPEEDYVLLHGGKPIDLTLPFRQSGLVNNAALEFKKGAVASSGSQNKPVVIKIRIPGTSDVVGQFSGSTTLSEVLASENLSGELSMNGQKLESAQTLGSLGGSRLLLTFQPLVLSKTSELAAIAVDKQRDSSILVDEKDASVDFSDPRVAKYTQRPAAASLSALEDPPEEPSRSQFLAYYHQLKSQAEPPMLSKETREKMQAASRSEVTETVVRVKFPDQSSLEGKFRNGEVGKDLFDFLKLYLADTSAPYELVSIRPSFVLGADMMLSTQLGSRAMLLFRPKAELKAPFLNEKAHKLAIVSASSPSAAPSNENIKEPTDSISAGPKSKKKGLPKWLKLHK